MENNKLHIGSKAPDFIANSTTGQIKMSDYKGKWVVLFSHPGDFTPVCTTEFIAFANANNEFVKKNTQLIGLSIDSNPSHLAWIHAIYLKTGITIPFPVIADRMGDVARMYGMLAPEVSTQETVRNVFFIDPQQTIRAILIYPMTNGRNVPEILRLLDALQTTDNYKAVTPADWQPGQPTLVPPPQTYSQLLSREQNPQELNLDCKDWYLCYSTPQLPAVQAMINEDSDHVKTASLDMSQYDLDTLDIEVEDLIIRMESARPTGIPEEQRRQYFALHREAEQTESRVDYLEDKAKADYHAGAISWTDYRNLARRLEVLEERLDRAEDRLKRIFRIND